MNDDVFLDYAIAHRHNGEDAITAARGIIVHAAMARSGGKQNAAAETIGVTKRAFNYYAAQWKLRRKDR